jgi:ectoine hydroxylase-related dioxygenase (phytanoyl-CoA dioxygenase family)
MSGDRAADPTVNRDPQSFAREGYCVFPRVFDADATAANRRLLQEAIDTDILERANYLLEPHTLDDRWMEICRHSALLDAVATVLGPNLILVYSSVFIKPPGGTGKVAWHQDNNYWPSVHGKDVVTVWLALDDADAANSAIQVLPRSHTGYREYATVPAAGAGDMLPKKVVVTDQMEDSAITLSMPAGALSLHDSFLLHGSGTNRTERRRAGYTIRYCSTDTAWVDVEEHPIPVYLVRGEAGARGAGYVDTRP